MGRFLVLTIAAGLLVLPADIDACSCAPRAPTCEAVFDSEAVFAATVTAVSDEPAIERAMAHAKRVRVQVTDAFRGDIGETVDVFTGRGDADCGFPFAGRQELPHLRPPGP